MSCAPCRATVSRVVPACCAFIEVHSRSRACPQPTAIRVRATRRRAPPIGRAPPPDPCRARAARSFPRTPPLYLTLSPAHYAPRRRARTSRLPSPRIFASLQTKSCFALSVSIFPCPLGATLDSCLLCQNSLIHFVRAIYWIMWVLTCEHTAHILCYSSRRSVVRAWMDDNC